MIPNFSVITMENNHHSSFYKPPPSACKVTLMCSYGGKFHPRHHDNLITYVEGEHKILCVERFIKLSALVAKLTSLTGGTDFSVKYQLPGDDLDNLVSVINDEDLHHMMVEYDRLSRRTSPKPARLRLFLFPLNNNYNSDSASSCSCSSSAPSTTTTELKQRFEEASAPPAPLPPPPSANPDFLFGLDDAAAVSECGNEAVREQQIQEWSEQLLHRKNDDAAAPLITHATTPRTDPGPVYLIQTPCGMYQAYQPVIGPEGQPVYFNLCY